MTYMLGNMLRFVCLMNDHGMAVCSVKKRLYKQIFDSSTATDYLKTVFRKHLGPSWAKVVVKQRRWAGYQHIRMSLELLIYVRLSFFPQYSATTLLDTIILEVCIRKTYIVMKKSKFHPFTHSNLKPTARSS